MKTPKRSSDVNVLSFQIVKEATEEKTPTDLKTFAKEKNPAAVALGRLGGLRGGPARAKKLSSKRRKEIARSAAKIRWKRK